MEQVLPVELCANILAYVYERTPAYIAIRESISIYNMNMEGEEMEGEDVEDVSFSEWYFNKLYLEKIIRQGRVVQASDYDTEEESEESFMMLGEVSLSEETYLASVIRWGRRYYETVYLEPDYNPEQDDVEEWPMTINIGGIVDMY
jgi:hypothetical protein